MQLLAAFNFLKPPPGRLDIVQNHKVFACRLARFLWGLIFENNHDEKIVGEHVDVEVGAVRPSDDKVLEIGAELGYRLFVSFDDVWDFLKTLGIQGLGGARQLARMLFLKLFLDGRRRRNDQKRALLKQDDFLGIENLVELEQVRVE